MTGLLEFDEVDYMNDVNTQYHVTDMYNNKNLVLRRAQVFELAIHFKNRAFDENKDLVHLEFGIGVSPAALSGTKQKLDISKKIDKDIWSCEVVENEKEHKTVVVKVNIPNDAIIGKYNVVCEINKKSGGKQKHRHTLPQIAVIFNPFSKDDDVYMENEVDREEYVLNDHGVIFAGSWNHIGKVQWLFGQFDEGILDVVFKMFSRDHRYKANPVKSLKRRNSPVYVARVLSAMANVNDDNGVVTGNWSGNYSDGKSPTDWNGSVKILKQWMRLKRGVNYGQCWVFSGVLTTVLRAVGIPARPVTNFNSAHDREYNMSIDKFFYSNGTQANLSSGDSIWNFHVWNDCWMKRTDLPTGYDGWQSVDSTPQEPSEKVFQCGPAPVNAIKNGEINIGYDTDFLFGEVNADVVNFLVDDYDHVLKRLKVDSRHVGKMISTKSPGSNERLDITDQYKYKEGTKEERAAFEKAKLRGKLPPWHKYIKVQPEGDINIEVNTKVAKTITGKPIEFTVSVENTTDSTADCVIITRLESMFYNGTLKSGIKKIETKKSLKGKEKYIFDISATFNEYGFVLTHDRAIRCFVSVRNTKNDNLYMDNKTTVLKHPKCVQLTVPQTLNKGPFEIKYHITNPFPVALSICKLDIDGSGFSGEAVDQEIKIENPIPSGGSASGTITASAYRRGKKTIVANLESQEIKSIKAKAIIFVK